MRVRKTLLILLTAVVTLAGLTELVTVIRGLTAVHLQAAATVDGLTAGVDDAGWLDMQMPTQDGYQMPASMMPGMPADGDERLSVSMTVTNANGAARPLRAINEFVLHTAKGGKSFKAVGSTFGDLPRVAPASAVTGSLFFDLPTANLTNSIAWVEWSHAGVHKQLQIPADGVAPAHTHGS